MQDLSSLSNDELNELQRGVTQAIDAAHKKQIAAAKEEIRHIAREAGIDLHELVKSQRSNAPAKYANPADQRQQWSGHGKRPKWFKDWVDSGKPVEQLHLGPS